MPPLLALCWSLMTSDLARICHFTFLYHRTSSEPNVTFQRNINTINFYNNR